MISLQNARGFSVQALYQELNFCASQKYSSVNEFVLNVESANSTECILFPLQD